MLDLGRHLGQFLFRKDRYFKEAHRFMLVRRNYGHEEAQKAQKSSVDHVLVSLVPFVASIISILTVYEGWVSLV